MKRLDLLGAISEEPERLTRQFAGEAMRRANDAVAEWMNAAGMVVRHDNIGNLRGRYEAETQNRPTLILGSHLDTVRDAGKYDGPLGVIAAIAAVQRLHGPWLSAVCRSPSRSSLSPTRKVSDSIARRTWGAAPWPVGSRRIRPRPASTLTG